MKAGLRVDTKPSLQYRDSFPGRFVSIQQGTSHRPVHPHAIAGMLVRKLDPVCLSLDAFHCTSVTGRRSN